MRETEIIRFPKFLKSCAFVWQVDLEREKAGKTLNGAINSLYMVDHIDCDEKYNNLQTNECSS